MLYIDSWRALCAAVILIDQSLLSHAVMRQDSEILASFGQPIQLFGEMMENNIDFVDGLNVDVYAPTNRTFTVTMNNNPMTGRYVTGTTGQQFLGLLGYSYVIKTNTNASDLIARIEMPYDPTKLAQLGIDPSNTFVGKMAPDGKSWQVVNSARNVNKIAFKARVEKMSSIDGEYRLLGRLGTETENVFNEYGTSPQEAVQIVGGGRQDVEFIDGLRFSVMSDQNLTMNVNFFSPIPPGMVPAGMTSLYAFGYTINTTQGFEVIPLVSSPGSPPSAPSSMPSGAIPVPPGLSSLGVPNAVPNPTGASPQGPVKSSIPPPASGSASGLNGVSSPPSGSGPGPNGGSPPPNGSGPKPSGVSPPLGGSVSGPNGGSSPWAGSGPPYGGQNGGQPVPNSPKPSGGTPNGPWGGAPPSGGNAPSWGGYGGQPWGRFVQRQAPPAATDQPNTSAGPQPGSNPSPVPPSGQSAASAAPVPGSNPVPAPLPPSQPSASPAPPASPLPPPPGAPQPAPPASPLPPASLGAPVPSVSLGTLLPPVPTGSVVPVPPPGPVPPVSVAPGPAPPPPPGFVQELTVEIPINLDMLMTLMGGPNTGANGVQTQSSGVLGESAADSGDDMLRNIKFQVARRDVGAATQPFAPFPGPGGPNAGASGAVTTGLSITNGKLVITGAQQLDGEYVVLIPTDGLIVSSNGQPIKTGNVGDASAVRFSVGGVYAVAVVMFAMLVL